MTTFTVTSEQLDTLSSGGRVVIGVDEEPCCDCSEHRPGMHVNTAKCPNIGGTLSPGALVTVQERKKQCYGLHVDWFDVDDEVYDATAEWPDARRIIDGRSVSAVLEAVVPWGDVWRCATDHPKHDQSPWPSPSGWLHLTPEQCDPFIADPPAFVVVLAASRTEEET